VLLKLAAKGHKIADDILAFRELTKLKSTYVDSLPLLINKKREGCILLMVRQ
jgi:DNA polymerase-1